MIKKPNRIFAFGCSYTGYLWPTWADIIAHDLEPAVYYNHARPGLGNYAIYSRLVEADIRHKFTPDDMILVNWTGWAREDRFLNPHGFERGHGSVLHKHFYDDKYINKYWSVENDIIRSANAIVGANRMFDITYQSSLYDWGVPERTIPGITNNTVQNNMFAFYQPLLPKDPDVWLKGTDADILHGNDVFNGVFKTTGVAQYETHPDIISHMNWVENTVGIKLKDSTKMFCIDTQNKIVYYTIKHADQYQNNIHGLFKAMIERDKIISWNTGLDPDRLKFQ